MTKALQLARSFHAAGHRVVLVESAKYRLHRAPVLPRGRRLPRRARARPRPTTPTRCCDVVRREGVDVFVPVCSPAASVPDAAAPGSCSTGVCEVVHLDAGHGADARRQGRVLAGRRRARAARARLRTASPIPSRSLDFDFAARAATYILKRIAYDPVRRLDLTRLPRATPAEQRRVRRAACRSRADDPWILQEFVEGQEYCTHGTVRDGRLQVYVCCESSAFQLNYADGRQARDPRLGRALRRRAAARPARCRSTSSRPPTGTPYAIECNPRTHSAITMFHDHPRRGGGLPRRRRTP